MNTATRAATAANVILEEDRRERALATTVGDLTGALSRAFAAMPAAVRRGIAADVKAGARIVIRQPWRLERVFLSPDTRPLAGLIRECRRRIEAHRDLGRVNHWAYDANFLMALLSAHLALRWMRRHGEVPA